MIGNGKETYSDSTLMKLNKAELINIIRILESNLKSLDETFEIQTQNTIKLLNNTEKEYKEKLEALQKELETLALKEIKEPLYECYERREGRFYVRTIFYSEDQINEFCNTCGSRIISASGRNDLFNKLLQNGQVTSIWDMSYLDTIKIPEKYKPAKTEISSSDSNRISEIRECFSKYISYAPVPYLYKELGSKSFNELTYVYRNSLLTGIIGKDGYPDIINEKGESVFNYIEEMELSIDEINEIRGIKEKSDLLMDL